MTGKNWANIIEENWDNCVDGLREAMSSAMEAGNRKQVVSCVNRVVLCDDGSVHVDRTTSGTFSEMEFNGTGILLGQFEDWLEENGGDIENEWECPSDYLDRKTIEICGRE